MNLNEGIRALVDSIKGTAEYSNMKKAKALIDQNPATKSEMENFNRKQSELLSGRLSKNEAEHAAEELQKRFSDLSRNPQVDRFLKSIKIFNEMMDRIYKGMGDLLEKDLKSK